MEKICNKNICTACKACENACPRNCIHMESDDLDTPYPVINYERCVDCGNCRRVCPNCNKLDFHETRKVLAAWSLDAQTRHESASGGVASELYRYAIENGWYAYGVSINRHKATFIEVLSKEEQQRVRNSKYVFSDTSCIYPQINKRLKDGNNVLFIGLPCQVAGLYSFLGHSFPNLVTVDIVCHGVVPEEYLKQHIERIEKLTKRKTEKIYFRNPDLYTFTFTFSLEDHERIFYKRQVYEDDVYQLGYHKALIYRENCYNCKYAQQKRIGDLTICDFSEVGKIIPVDYNRMNVSCVLVNTERGNQIIERLSDRLYLEERPRKEAFDFEPQLNHPYKRHPGRGIFVTEYKRTHDFHISATKALKKELDEYKATHPGILLRTINRTLYISKALYYKICRIIARYMHRPSIPLGGVLMLHRIDTPEKDGVWYNQHLKLSPKTIDEMVEYARKRKCRFVSLDEMSDAIHRKKNVRRLIAVTLDDGYSDNHRNGAIVFRHLNVPYTIYVCTKMVNGEMLYWWEILEKLVLDHNQLILSDGQSFDCSTKERKAQSFMDIREIIIKQPQGDLKSHLKELFSNYDIDWSFGNDSLGLTWEQIRELKNDPLATIGNHTYSHCAFTGLSDEEIREDINKATREMKENTGMDMGHFAFPYGEATAVSRHDVELVKRLGFRTSATTKDGLVCYGTDPLELPRLFVTERNWKQVIDRIAENC